MSPPAFPTDVNNSKQITDYVVAVATIFGGFVVAAILLSIVMIVICACFNRKPRKSFNYNKWLHLGLAIFVVAIAVVGCGVGWGYNTQCENGVKQMTSSIDDVLVGSVGVVNNVQGFLGNLSTNLSNKIDNIVVELHNVKPNTYTSPIDGVITSIDSMASSTNELNYTATDIILRDEHLKEEITVINKQDIFPPNATDVPQLSSDITTSIANGNVSIYEMRNNTLQSKARIVSALDDIINNLINGLSNNSATYQDQIKQASSSFDSSKKSISDIKKDYNKYEDQINLYSYRRTMAVNGVMILPIVIALLGIAAVFFKLVILLKITAVLSFIFFFWYMLIAGVNYTLFAVADGFCQSQSTIVGKVLNSVDTTYTAGNQSYKMSDAINGIINCHGNTTFISVFHAQYVIDDLETLIQNKVDEIKNQANNVDFDQDFADAQANLANYKNSTQNINFTQGSNLTQVEFQLVTLLNHYEAGKSDNETTVQNDMNTINTIVAGCTPARPQCEITNTSAFNLFNCSCVQGCTNDNVACATYADGLPAWAAVYVVIPALNASVNDVRAVQADIQHAAVVQQSITNSTNNISLSLTLAKTNAKEFVVDTTDLLLGVVVVIDDALKKLGPVTQCAFVGDSYSHFTEGFCKKFSPSLEVIAAMMLLGSATLFFTVIHSCIAQHRIRGSGEDGDEPEKGTKSISLHAR